VAEPTGYRVTRSRRDQLLMAQAFLGLRSMQAVIDAAVDEFLAGMRTGTPGFADALDNAARFRDGTPENVTRMHRT
jgi:hypothetical protein